MYVVRLVAERNEGTLLYCRVMGILFFSFPLGDWGKGRRLLLLSSH